MGLPEKRHLTSHQLRRIHITTIRQNWHILPESQIIELLGWTRQKYDFTLKEDDFLNVKLGRKPECPELLYRPPSAKERAQAADMRRTLREVLGAALRERGEDRFQFIQALSARPARAASQGARQDKCVWTPRFLYSFFSLYGDPLLETDINPLPNGYMERLAQEGVSGVWIQAVLNTLAPSKHFPEFGEASDTRLANLNKLVERAGRFGLKILLYINEPRAMPEGFFNRHPEIKGAPSRGLYAMCTSVPAVREWIAEGLAHVFKQVPGLGGIFTITMSENHTNCFSHSGGWDTKAPVARGCPRCSGRQSWDVLAELHRTFRDGVRRSSPDAYVIAWDWAWPDEMSARLIPLLPSDTRFLSVSEWYQPVHRGGVNTRVGEYSISVVGPGPRATQNWQRARSCGIEPMAKVQFNNTWEISAVPYIPVPNLILEHCANLSKAGISGLMLSWTCGGYPSPNLAAAKAYYFEPRPPDDEILRGVAVERYGKNAAPGVLAAWKKFSEAFVEFPYGVSIYVIPTQHGPANPLRLRPTGYRSAMMLFPYDDLKAWCGIYPPEVVLRQFTKMAAVWKEGLASLRSALSGSAGQTDLAIAETCYAHFQSVANQVEFCILRAKPVSREVRDRMRAIAEQEIEIAKGQYTIARRHSLIAFEASNQYYYTPLDLAEKILNCRQVLAEILD